MIHQWKMIDTRGQEGIGHVEIYQSNVDAYRACAIISYFPQISGEPNKRNVNVCLLFEGEKEDMTDGLFHEIYDDISDIVKSKENTFFQKGGAPLEYIITQTILVKKLPAVELLTNGDYSVSPI